MCLRAGSTFYTDDEIRTASRVDAACFTGEAEIAWTGSAAKASDKRDAVSCNTNFSCIAPSSALSTI